MQHLLLQRNVDAFIGIACGLAFIIEGPHKRVDEEYPGKTLRVEIVRHHGAIGCRTLRVDFVENHVEVGGAWVLLLEFGFFRDQPLGVLRGEICVGESEQGFGGGDEFGIIVARAQGFAEVGWRGHGIDIRIV
jgi:hypothetical protein